MSGVVLVQVDASAQGCEEQVRCTMSSGLAVGQGSQEVLDGLALEIRSVGVLRAYFNDEASQVVFLLNQCFVSKVTIRVVIELVLIFVLELLHFLRQSLVLL